MIETIEIEVSDDEGASWMLQDAPVRSLVVAWLNHNDGVWEDPLTGLVYRWRQ